MFGSSQMELTAAGSWITCFLWRKTTDCITVAATIMTETEREIFKVHFVLCSIVCLKSLFSLLFYVTLCFVNLRIVCMYIFFAFIICVNRASVNYSKMYE